jgi:hypothetical protein
MTDMKFDPYPCDLYETTVGHEKKALLAARSLPPTIGDAITAPEQEIAVLHQPLYASLAWLQENNDADNTDAV